MDDLRPMDYVRGALANAIAEGLDLIDLFSMAEHARTCAEWDTAVNELVQATCNNEADFRDQCRGMFPK